MSSIIDWLWPHGSGNGTTTAPTGRSNNLTNETPGNNAVGEEETATFVEAEAGAIAGLVFGLLFSLAIIVSAYYMYRRHRQQNEEYQKSLKTFITSRNNAGVYMDTTTMINSEDPVPGQVPGKSKSVYASLRQNPDMYEDDSEDEI